MDFTLSYASLGTLISGLFIYSYILSIRLRGPHPSAEPERALSMEELEKVSYAEIDMLKVIPTKVTHRKYTVIGYGFLGRYIVKLLLMRGETNILIIDVHPPSDIILDSPNVTFSQADIRSLESVRSSLKKTSPDVIYHTAAIINMFERYSYTWDASYNVNVLGTQNVLTIANELVQDSGKDVSFIYTSTGDTVLPRPRFLHLGWDYRHPPHNSVTVSDDTSISLNMISQSCYSRSKKMAEALVEKADGHGDANGRLKTGILRPAYTILGPNDRLITSSLELPVVPVMDANWSCRPVSVWDVAAAHLLYEEALDRNPQGCHGQAFLISGKSRPWRYREIRNAIKFYAKKKQVKLQDVSPLLMYTIAHAIELFLLFRFYILLVIFKALRMDGRPTTMPKWFGNAAILQPATLEYWSDVDIDDSRARRILGYQPQWETAQSIRDSVEQYESALDSGKGTGLKIKSK